MTVTLSQSLSLSLSLARLLHSGEDRCESRRGSPFTPARPLHPWVRVLAQRRTTTHTHHLLFLVGCTSACPVPELQGTGDTEACPTRSSQRRDFRLLTSDERERECESDMSSRTLYRSACTPACPRLSSPNAAPSHHTVHDVTLQMKMLIPNNRTNRVPIFKRRKYDNT